MSKLKRSTASSIMAIAMAIGSTIGYSALAEESEAVCSQSAFIYVAPEKTILWPTCAGGTITLPLNYPEGVSGARLEVKSSKSGEPAIYSLLKSEYPTSYELSLPTIANRYDEQVVTLTLTYDNEKVETAHLGLVRGFDRGGEAVYLNIIGLDKTKSRWTKVKGAVVLEIPEGAISLELNNEKLNTGLNGAAGWYVFETSKLPADSKLVLTTADHLQYSATLTRVNDGFMVQFN